MNKFIYAAAIYACALALLTVNVYAEGEPAVPEVTVYKSPTCGCCQGWVDYLEDNGFRVETHNVDDLSGIKSWLGISDPSLQSCHTAVVDGYVVEGHVPVDDIRRLLKERPDVIGVAAPGMPAMSPGMSSIEPKGYDVLSFDGRGRVEVFSRY